ncbi:MAG: class I SAM-dependent methyltransferase [Gammaproteobacteria bacterium]|nr:class I SAM-dependent methyltransferase [Gammaproteobacteria bacterium]
MNNDNQPDWDRIAEKFDCWTPLLAPAGEALLSALNSQCGDKIIDIASGTGEPALTLAKKMGGAVTITGTDAAAGMVKAANSKAQSASVNNIEFRCMAAEQLDFADATFDRALCRFGVMLFDDAAQGLNEIARVLKPGGRFSCAVWHTPETIPTLLWSYQVFKERLPEAQLPPLYRATSLGEPERLRQLLGNAGFDDIHIDIHRLDYTFPSFAAYWATLDDSELIKQQLDALPADTHETIRHEIEQLAEPCLDNGGQLVIPHQYLIASAQRR